MAGADEPVAHALPGGQDSHSSTVRRPVVLPNDPAGHAVAEAAPSAQYEPSLHSSQAVAPLLSWKRPAGQRRQAAKPCSAMMRRPGVLDEEEGKK